VICRAPLEDVIDVATWLRGLGLERHEAAFREHLIDLDVVRELTESDLEKLGLALGDRKRLLTAIGSLPTAEAAAATSVAAPPRARQSRATACNCDVLRFGRLDEPSGRA
jgi:SAM domain (Sterile alpha motif)